MFGHDRAKRVPSRRVQPSLELVESRTLLSGVIASLASHVHTASFTPDQQLALLETLPSFGFHAPTQGVNPTGREVARQQFIATFGGPYTVGPGQFGNQSLHIFIRGVGSSNAFLHGNTSLSIATSGNPDGNSVGVATMFDRNVNSAGQFGVDLAGSPTDVDRMGRPTQMVWVPDINLSAGAFGESSGQGTVQIRYTPSGKPTPGGFSHGTATLVFRGAVFTIGTNNQLSNANLVQRGGRVDRRS